MYPLLYITRAVVVASPSSNKERRRHRINEGAVLWCCGWTEVGKPTTPPWACGMDGVGAEGCR